MKHQRRELNVFSMSALDLFASGMGAFVLLAIIALPFFPNTGDSQERIEDLKSSLEAAESRSQNLEDVLTELQESSSAQKAQSELLIPNLDIVICLDVTGSMQDQIEGLKREISSLAAVLDKISPSVGMGIVAFGDRKWNRPIRGMDITRTSNMSEIQSFVDRLTPNMQDRKANENTDRPEAVASALESAIGMSWRSESEKRYIVVITDNPAYRDRTSDALASARSFSSKNQHHVSSVLAHYYGAEDLEETQRFLMQLAESGNGEYVDAGGGESVLSSILLAILGT